MLNTILQNNSLLTNYRDTCIETHGTYPLITCNDNSLLGTFIEISGVKNVILPTIGKCSQL